MICECFYKNWASQKYAGFALSHSFLDVDNAAERNNFPNIYMFTQVFTKILVLHLHFCFLAGGKL